MTRWPRALVGVLGTALVSLALAPTAGAWIYWGHEYPYGSGVGRAALDSTQLNDSFVPGPPGAYAFSRGVAVDSTYLYWGTHGLGSVSGGAVGPPAIGRSLLDGSGVEYSFTGAPSNAITGLSVSATDLYWTGYGIDTADVGETPVAGGGQPELFTSVFGQPNPRTCGVATDGTYVYFASRGTSSIGRAKLADFGTANVPEGQWIALPATANETVVPCGVAVDSKYVYWGINEVIKNGSVSLGTTVGRALKSDGSEATDSFAAIGKQVTGVAVDGSFIYASNLNQYTPGGGSIGRASLSNGVGDPNFISGLTAPFGVAVDGGGPTAAPPSSGGSSNYIPPLAVGCSGCGGGANATGSSVPPDFSRVWGSNTTFAPASWLTPGFAVAKSARAKGTVFNYILDKAGTVKIVITGLASGRRVGKRCLTPSPKNTRRRRCSREITYMTLTRLSSKGHNQVPFSGRIRGKVLAPGSYIAKFIATAATSKATKTKSFRFRIVRP
jgi:hypothetical protein